MRSAGKHAAIARFAGGALAAVVLVATPECILIVNASDYHVGPIATFSGCADTAQCPAGDACVAGLCQPLCDPTGSNCPLPYQCVPGQTDASPDQVCMPHCNPVLPGQPDSTHVACSATEICVPFPSATPQFTDCANGPAGALGQAQTCTDVTQCLPGYECGPVVGAARQCQKYCRTDQPTDCQAGSSCEPFIPPFLDGPQELGVCSP
jgi:hypothetical protein